MKGEIKKELDTQISYDVEPLTERLRTNDGAQKTHYKEMKRGSLTTKGENEMEADNTIFSRGVRGCTRADGIRNNAIPNERLIHQKRN